MNKCNSIRNISNSKKTETFVQLKCGDSLFIIFIDCVTHIGPSCGLLRSVNDVIIIFGHYFSQFNNNLGKPKLITVDARLI